jgi:hypothetical protein
MISHDSVVKSGTSNILEIPISAALIPFIGTTMRISPLMTKIVQRYLYRESKRTDKPVVFLFHPNECLDVGDKKPFFQKESFTKEIVPARRTKNLIEYLFADLIRHKLKNLGMNAVKLMDEILASASEYGFEFVSASEYRKIVSV